MSLPENRIQHRVLRVALCVLSLSACFLSASSADEPAPAPSLDIGWTQNVPVIDGHLELGEWSDGAHVDGFAQATPNPGAEATQRTEVWILTDGETLYIAARLWDTDVDAIVAQRMLRDGETQFDDRFGFTIDTFNDRQNGYFFQTNPNGVRRDSLIEGPTVDSSWDTLWFVETSVDETGWTVEIALPYHSINFDPNGEIWGLNMARGIRRNDEIDRWSDPVRERFLIAMGRAGTLVGMEGIGQGLGVKITPSVAVRRVENEEDNTSDTDADPSLDAFYKVTPAWTTALTVNTDFSESAVDERQVNLTRFGLFFPEKRDFFLQDALIFGFGGIEENGRPFFSRRMGLGSDGDVRDIIAGGKVTGRSGPIKFGLIDVVMDERANVDQTNLMVARLAASVLDESTLGALVTHGNPDANGDNTVAGMDFIYRNSDFLDNKSFQATAWVQGSFSDPDSNPDPNAPPLIDGNGFAYGGTVSYPNDRFNWELGLREFDDKFNPELGFVNRIGIREYDGSFRYRTRPTVGPFRTIDNQIEGLLVTSSTASNTVRSGKISLLPFILTTPIIDSIEFRYTHTYEFISQDFRNLEIGPGEYHFDEGRIKVLTSRNRRVQGTVEAGYGTFFDGTRFQTISELQYRPVKYLLLQAEYEFNDIRLPGSDLLSGNNDQDRDKLVHVARGKFDIFFTTEISLQTLVQWDDLSDSLGFNARFRWIVEEGREFFIVVNQGADTRDDVRATRTELVTKAEWSFRF